MGQKVNPKALRLGIVDNWDSVWYDNYNYKNKILEDYQIRNFLTKELSRAGVSTIKIFRKAENLQIKADVARPGVVFGKSNIDVEFLLVDLKKLINQKNITLDIIETKNPDSNAHLLSAWISGQIEKRIPFRRAMKMAIQKCLKSGAKGVKVSCSGRLGGIEIARCEWYKEGKIPLHTIRSNVQYSLNEAHTTYGKIGVKVWIYHGDKHRSKGIKNAQPKENQI